MTVRITLEPTVATATLTVVATPNDSIITIDNENVSSKTVNIGTSHTVVVRKTGYATYTEVVTVNEDTTLEVTLKNTKTVRYNVLKEGSTDYSDISFGRLVNGEYVTLPTGENIELPFDTDIIVKATAPGYQIVTRTDNFSSNAPDAYDVAIINILIPQIVSPQVRITLRNVPYQAIRKANGVSFAEDYVDVDAGSLVIIDITASGYTNYRIALIPTEDKTIYASMTPYDTTLDIGNNILFYFEGSDFDQLFTIDNTINSAHGGYLEISKGTHKIETHLEGGTSLIEFTDIYNDHTDFYVLID